MLVSGLDSGSVSAAALRYRALGALIVTGFGSLWMLLGAHHLKRLDWRAWLTIACIALVLALPAARQWHSMGPRARLETRLGGHPHHSRIAREFDLVLALEWIPIFGAAFVLGCARRTELILPVIALIVGLHFFPLAAIFGSTLYYFTGAAIAIISLVALALRRPVSKQVTACFGCGLVLWSTAALLLV